MKGVLLSLILLASLSTVACVPTTQDVSVSDGPTDPNAPLSTVAGVGLDP